MDVCRKILLPNSQIFVYLLFGISAYAMATLFKVNIRDFPLLEQIMYLAIAVGLYINVLSIQIKSFKIELRSILAGVILGVPIKIVLPGLALAVLSPDNYKIAFLCSTVIAQIDPIIAAQSIQNTPIKLNKRSETILRAWSSFDDPVTVLFAFYIFLPISQGIEINFIEYFVNRILLDFFIIAVIHQIYTRVYWNWRKRIKNTVVKVIDITIISLVFIYGLLTSSFLAPAAIGLFIRPFSAKSAGNLISGIAFFSAIVIGAFAATSRIDWGAGIILAGAMLVAHAIATHFLIKTSSVQDKLKLIFSHQNGMTAILLTVALEVSGKGLSNLLPITLPAIVLIALFYLASNWIVDNLLTFTAS